MMTDEQHRARHGELHQALDELIAGWAMHNPGKMYSSSTIMDLMQWSFEQTRHPQPPRIHTKWKQ
jgi:hypothetical protein